ncbi:MAG TPA: hypothetical protein VLA19_18330 [Herpetosiphonaceae bacterium]|nr:hypothetical protein [Herpetosiphonaceae bacterium]
MESVSFIVEVWRDLQDRGVRLRVWRVDGGQEVQLADASFLVRVTVDAERTVHRCLIRHPASGREAHVQAGRQLGAFIKACLLEDAEPLRQESTSG